MKKGIGSRQEGAIEAEMINKIQIQIQIMRGSTHLGQSQPKEQ